MKRNDKMLKDLKITRYQLPEQNSKRSFLDIEYHLSFKLFSKYDYA